MSAVGVSAGLTGRGKEGMQWGLGRRQHSNHAKMQKRKNFIYNHFIVHLQKNLTSSKAACYSCLLICILKGITCSQFKEYSYYFRETTTKKYV